VILGPPLARLAIATAPYERKEHHEEKLTVSATKHAPCIGAAARASKPPGANQDCCGARLVARCVNACCVDWRSWLSRVE
jgi:hypothetical protein